nr:hypothetical protein [Oceanococcus sp. HetDA_MAG_MS8]
MNNTLQFDRIPPTLPLFAKLAVTKAKPEKILPVPLIAQASGIRPKAEDVEKYLEVCGGQANGRLPILYPQVMSTPLTMSLLVHPQFPLAALGLVHVENTVEQQRAPRVDEALDFLVTIPNIERTSRGYEFDMLTEVSVEGEKIWQSRARILSRAKDPNAAKKPREPRRPPSASDWPLIETYSLAPNLGRRYARVSGDFNPIHLYANTAKLLGFKRAIIHGMWSAAATAVALDIGPGPGVFDCEFKTPLFLPGKANLHAKASTKGREFLLQDAKSFKPILSGSYKQG